MYKDSYFEEVVFQQKLEYEQLEEQKISQLQNDIDLEQNIKSIIKKAEDRQKNQIHGSNRSRIKGIKDNRQAEKDKNRKSEQMELNKPKVIKESAKVITFDESNEIGKSDTQKDAKNNRLELLKKIRDEKLGR